MSKFNNGRVIAAAATFAAAAMLSVFSFGSNANAAGNALRCQGETAAKVVACCEQLTKDHLPLWMKSTGTTCRKAVRCQKERCIMVITHDLHDESGEGGRKSQ